MKKASLLASAAFAATAVLAAAPAFAQGAGPFADVPTDHWAYQSVDKLQKAGIVIGYPDGTYGGKRAMTRYEFAVAIARMLDKIPGPIDTSNFATKSDLAGLATKDEVDQLRKLINEFRTELTTLGVDLDATKKRVDALEARVTAIETEMKRVKISGDINIMARANHRTGSQTHGIIDQDGFRVTRGAGSRGGPGADITALHDMDLNIKARLSETATAEAVINFGNYLNYLSSVSSYSGARSDRPITGQVVQQDEEQSIYKLVLEAPIKIPGVGGANLAVGRLPIQFTPYTLKLIDVDQYFYNKKTDLGDIPVDGAKGTFNLGPVGVTAFAAKSNPIKYVGNRGGKISGDLGYGLLAGAGRSPYLNGTAAGNGLRGNSIATIDDLGAATLTGNRPVQASQNNNGSMPIDQLAGVRLVFGTSKLGTIGGTYIAAAGNSGAALPTFQSGSARQRLLDDRAVFDRVYVYGLDFNGSISGIGLTASYTKSDTRGNRGNYNAAGVLTSVSTNQKKITKANDEFEVGATYATGALSLGAGYREIGPYFAAPGYWGRIGSYTNPVDIQGAYVNAGYALSTTLSLNGAGQFYKGTGKDTNLGGLTKDDKINNFKVGLKYGLTSASNVDLGVEYTQYTLSSGATNGKPEEIFYNIGYGYSFNPNTSFKLLYQIVDYTDKGTGFDTLNRKGGIIATQFAVKF